MKRLVITLIVFIASQFGYSQEISSNKKDTVLVDNTPPIIVEGLAGNRGYFVTSTMMGNITQKPNLNYFTTYSLLKEWGNNGNSELMLQSHLTYQLYKNISLTGGIHYSNVTQILSVASSSAKVSRLIPRSQNLCHATV